MGKDRERETIAHVACPECGAAVGRRCLGDDGQPLGRQRLRVHRGRLDAWRAQRPTDPLDADIVMQPVYRGPVGARTSAALLLAPLSARGRAAYPSGPTEIHPDDARLVLARLRAQGLIVMREDG